MKLILNNSSQKNKTSYENEKSMEMNKSHLNSSDEEESSGSFNEKSSPNSKTLIKHKKERQNLIRNAKRKIGKFNILSISHKKIERAKKMNLFFKVQQDKKEININQMISFYVQKCQNNDEIIKEDINSQISFIKARFDQKSNIRTIFLKSIIIQRKNYGINDT